MANDVKNDPKAVKTTVGVVTNAKIQDSQQPKMPLGVATAMFLAPLCWYGPIGSTRSVLIPQLFSQLIRHTRFGLSAFWQPLRLSPVRLPTYCLVLFLM